MTGPRIYLVASDLMVGSRIAGLAAACQATVTQGRDPSVPGGSFDLLIIDLQAVGADLPDLVGRVRAGSPADRPLPIVAFGPHVATHLLDEARAAGVDEVVSRGALLGSFAALVQRWCG